ncbi:hypothetical protein AB0M42_01745 [Streptomyces sp. NPDC051784]|uniref:DUF6892 domain-containing protein n=1 Tax=Streptomyces sp. NPDC051784 TaxID=3155805 RepID=UPI0034205F22
MAQFKDFNFKLLVIEKLMYEDETLTPAFSIDERMRDRGITDTVGYVYEHDLAYKVLDESRAYFEQLEISDELLASVEELLLDGGHQVYYECSPVWDGEDDLFDVRSLDDLALLPNLRLIDNADMLTLPDAEDQLAARGIEAG